jgi:hypothetical protein
MGSISTLMTIWRTLRRGDVAAIFLLAAIITALLAIAVLKVPNFGWTGNWGFGPDWECSYPGKGEPVCVKRPAPAR